MGFDGEGVIRMEEDFKFAGLAAMLIGLEANIFNISHVYEDIQ
ncbi:MAG: hypothetical protein V1645_04950 [archaeon]